MESWSFRSLWSHSPKWHFFLLYKIISIILIASITSITLMILIAMNRIILIGLILPIVTIILIKWWSFWSQSPLSISIILFLKSYQNYIPQTGAKILNLSKNSQFHFFFYYKILIFKVIFQKNTHFLNIKFGGIYG